jgi:hypothetical protein
VDNRQRRLLVGLGRQGYLLRPLPTSLSHIAESSYAYRYRQQVLGWLAACADSLRVIRSSIRLFPAVPHISTGPKALPSGSLTLRGLLLGSKTFFLRLRILVVYWSHHTPRVRSRVVISIQRVLGYLLAFSLTPVNACYARNSRSTKKLDHKKLGPFKIIRVAGKRACELELPPQVKIHNVFHIELLERYRQSSIPGREQRPPTPEDVDNEGEVLYEVGSIVGSRKSGRGLVEYLVKWRGYSMSDCTYQVMDAMNEEVLDLVRNFHRRNPKAVKDQRLRL